MVTLGLGHMGYAAAALTTAVHHPERAKMAAPLVLTLFGFTPIQVEVLIAGLAAAVYGAKLTAERIKSRLPAVAHVRRN